MFDHFSSLCTKGLKGYLLIKILHVFYRLAVLKTFAKFTRRRRFHCRYFPVNVVEIFLNKSFIDQPRTTFVQWNASGNVSFYKRDGLNISEVNPFRATDLFRYSLKASENQRFSNVFREYRKRRVVWNELIVKILLEMCCICKIQHI